MGNIGEQTRGANYSAVMVFYRRGQRAYHVYGNVIRKTETELEYRSISGVDILLKSREGRRIDDYGDQGYPVAVEFVKIAPEYPSGNSSGKPLEELGSLLYFADDFFLVLVD